MRLITALLAPFALNPSTRNGSSGRWKRTSFLQQSFGSTQRRKRYMSTSTLLNDSSYANPSSEGKAEATATATATTRKSIIHCNHAGASPSPSSVVDTVLRHMQIEQTVGGYTAAETASDHLDEVYNQVAQLLHDEKTTTANPKQEIALVESATVAWTRLFYSMAHYQDKKYKKKQRVILISEAEYAAGVVAACQWAKDHHDSNWTVLSIPSTKKKKIKATTPDDTTATATTTTSSTGMVDLEVLQQMLEGNYQYSTAPGKESKNFLDPTDIAMICITHIPTNSGIVNDVEGIGQLISNYNNKQQQPEDTTGDEESNIMRMPSILYLVDACQSIGQRNVDVEEIQCHGLVATGRKFLRAPRGTGFLYVPHKIADQLLPHHADHHGCPVVEVPQDYTHHVQASVESMLQIQPKVGAARFEFYESNIANKLGLGEAIRYALNDAGGMNHIQSTIITLAQELYQRLDANPYIQTHHPPMSGIVTFYVPNVPSSLIKQRLWESNNNSDEDQQFETSLVPATSTPLDSSQTQVPDLVRVSLSYTNTVEDITAFCKKLESIIQDLC